MQNECKSNANADQKQSNKTKLNKTKLDYTKKEDINKKNNTPDGDSFVPLEQITDFNVNKYNF